MVSNSDSSLRLCPLPVPHHAFSIRSKLKGSRKGDVRSIKMSFSKQGCVAQVIVFLLYFLGFVSCSRTQLLDYLVACSYVSQFGALDETSSLVDHGSPFEHNDTSREQNDAIHLVVKQVSSNGRYVVWSLNRIFKRTCHRMSKVTSTEQ